MGRGFSALFARISLRSRLSASIFGSSGFRNALPRRISGYANVHVVSLPFPPWSVCKCGKLKATANLKFPALYTDNECCGHGNTTE